jgi:hypothetical protein
MILRYETSVVVAGSGDEIPISLGPVPFNVPGSNLMISGFVGFDDAFVPDSTVSLELRDSGGNVVVRRSFPAVGFTSASVGSIFTYVFGVVGPTGQPIWSGSSMHIVNDEGTSVNWSGTLTFIVSVGNVIPGILSTDLNDPVSVASGTPAYGVAPTLLAGGLNLTFSPDVTSVVVNGTQTSGLFQTWVVDIKLEAGLPGFWLSNVALSLYLSNGAVLPLSVPDIGLGPASTTRYLLSFTETTSAIPTFIDFIASVSDPAVATAIRANAPRLTIEVHPFNYRRL